MKKFYLLMLATAALSATATEPAARCADGSFVPAAPLAARTHAAGPQKAAPADAAVHVWKSLGVCQWTDDVLPALFKGLQPYKVELEVEQDENDPALYRIVDPYSLRNPYYDELESHRAEGDNASGRYIMIDATDPENLIIEPSSIGLMYDGEELFVASYSYYEKIGDIDAGFCDTYGLKGKLSNGIFTFPGARAMWVSTASLDARGSGFYGNPNGAFRLVLPDAKDYSLEMLTADWCADDEGRIVFSPWGGDDVAYVKAGVVRSLSDEAGLKAIRDSSKQFVSRQGDYLSVDGAWGPNEKFYIVGYAYDAAGTLQGYDVNMFYTPDFSEGWTTLPGKARFTDYIVSNIYTDIDLGTYEVEVQENDALPGYYRLVDPYARAPYNTLMPGTHGAHSHYLYLDASDPDCVVLEESPIGMVLSQDGAMRVTSDAYILVQQGLPKDAIAYAKAAGTMKDGVITFPASCKIYAGYNTEGMDSWYYCNYKTDASGNVVDGDLRIDLSAATQGIADVEAESDAAVRYFNLQGVEINAPAAGSTVIRVCGRKAEKVRM